VTIAFSLDVKILFKCEKLYKLKNDFSRSKNN